MIVNSIFILILVSTDFWRNPALIGPDDVFDVKSRLCAPAPNLLSLQIHQHHDHHCHPCTSHRCIFFNILIRHHPLISFEKSPLPSAPRPPQKVSGWPPSGWHAAPWRERRVDKKSRSFHTKTLPKRAIPLSGALITISGTHFLLSRSWFLIFLYRFYLIELGLSAAAGNGKMHLIKVKPSNKSQSLKRKWRQKVQPQIIKQNKCTNRAVRLKHSFPMSCDVYEVSRRLMGLIIG